MLLELGVYSGVSRSRICTGGFAGGIVCPWNGGVSALVWIFSLGLFIIPHFTILHGTAAVIQNVLAHQKAYDSVFEQAFYPVYRSPHKKRSDVFSHVGYVMQNSISCSKFKNLDIIVFGISCKYGAELVVNLSSILVLHLRFLLHLCAAYSFLYRISVHFLIFPPRATPDELSKDKKNDDLITTS